MSNHNKIRPVDKNNHSTIMKGLVLLVIVFQAAALVKRNKTSVQTVSAKQKPVIYAPVEPPEHKPDGKTVFDAVIMGRLAFGLVLKMFFPFCQQLGSEPEAILSRLDGRCL